MTDKKSSKSRRKLLKSIAAGSSAVVAGKSLPESWSRPVVDSVMLPAHAQTSEVDDIVYAGSGLEVAYTIDPDNGTRLVDNILDKVVPNAHAVQPYPPTSTVCAIPYGDELEVTLQRSANNIRRRGMLNIDGTPGELGVYQTSAACAPPYDRPPYEPKPVGAYISEFDPNAGFFLQILRKESVTFKIWVPIGQQCPKFETLDGLCDGSSDE